MKTKRLVLSLFIITAAAARFSAEAGAAAGPPGAEPAGQCQFTEKPKVEKTAGGWSIRFAAKAHCDVTVAIVDQGGKIVRHLASGVLGPKAPPPLRQNSLAQSLTWDGKDDAGQAVPQGEYCARVGLGLRGEFDGLIGENPAAIGSVRALATGPRGEVFVFHVFGGLHPNDGSLSCSVFSREGKYLRTILPYPASLPEGKLHGFRRVQLSDGRRVPLICQGETRSFVPGAGDLPPHRAVATRDGRVAFVGIQEWVGTALRYAQPGVAQLVVLGADGSATAGGVLKTVLAPLSSTGASLAFSPDEKTLYAAGLSEGQYTGKPTHAVYKFAWDDEKPQVFVGEKTQPGADEKHLNQPMSVATDQQGRVYVADKGNDRIAVFAPDGSFLGALKVERPERVEVHGGTGAIYVLGGERVDQLQKFRAWNAAAPVAQVKLPSFRHERYTAVMALDGSAEPPLLWVGTPFGQYAHMALLRIEDQGEAFGKPVDVIDAKPPAAVGAVTDLSLDRASGRLYTGSGPTRIGPLFDGRSGKPRPMGLPTFSGSGCVATFGSDGNFYLYHEYPAAAISRFALGGQALPFAAAPRITGLGSPRLRGRGLTADRHGNVYVLWQKPKEKQSPGDVEDANALAVYGSDGQLKQEKLIDSQIRSLSSVRVDAAGNIYLAVGVRPAGVLVPEDFAQLDRGKPWKYGMNSTQLDWYPMMYGSIVKFGPQGGRIGAGTGGVPVGYGYGNKTEIEGAQWIYFGASNVPSWRTKGTPDVCLCESPRLDVDGFGRCFFPDACRCRAGVLDAAGNEICFFGAYGNQDSAGPASAVPVPAIPLCWLHAVAAGDDFVYLGDRLNRRVVRVGLRYAAEETARCP